MKIKSGYILALFSCGVVEWACYLIGLHRRPSLELLASRAGYITYRLQELDTGGDDQNIVYHGGGVNDEGALVGALLHGSDSAPAGATEWDRGQHLIHHLPSQDGGSATALSINRRGDVAGYGIVGIKTSALLWSGGKATVLAPLPGFASSIGNGINDQDWVAGYSTDNALKGQDWFAVHARACLWRDGAVMDLGVPPGCVLSRAYGLNNAGQVVGWTLTKDNKMHACLWENGVMRDLGTLPGGHVSTAEGVNNKGQIIGDSDTAKGELHTVIWQDGAIRDLGIPPYSTGGKPKAINDNGEVLGDSSEYKGNKLFIWDEKHGMRLIDTFDDSLAYPQRAVALGNDGRVYCAGVYVTDVKPPYDHRMFMLTPAGW